jgi:uncharacterized protein (DUF58 family)
MIMIGSAYENNLINIIAFFLLSLILISMVQTHNLLRGIEISAIQNQNGFALDFFKATIIAHDVDRQGQPTLPRPGVNIKLRRSEILSKNGFETAGAYPVQTRRYQTEARGFYQGQDLVLETRAPLGLFRAWSPRKFSYQFYVYPKPMVLAAWPWPDKAEGPELREDFRDLKAYKPGDSARHVDWRQWAKTNQMWTKNFENPEPDYKILKDSKVPGKDLEERLSKLCGWVLEESKNNKSYSVVIKNQRLGPGQGAQFTQKVLEVLSVCQELSAYE